MIFGKHINRDYLKYAGWLLMGLAALVAVDYFQLVIPNLYQMVINGMNQGYVLVDGVQMAFDMDFLLDKICMPLVWVILAMVIGRFGWRVCIFGAAIKVETDLRNDMFDHAKDLSVQYYQVNKVGNLMSLFTNDLETVQDCYGSGFLMFFDALVLFVLSVYKMWRMNQLLTVLCLIPMALLLGASTVVGNYLTKKWDIRQEAFSKLSDFSQESFSGIAVIKAFVKEAKELLAFRKLNEENEVANVEFTKASVLLRILVELFVESVVAVILGYGGYLVYNKTFNAVHNVSATAVQEYNKSTYEYTEADVQGLSDKFFSDHIISNTYEQQFVYGSKYFYGLASYMLRANYNYDSKYYIGASLRRDGLSRLSKDNRWGTFWGASAAWRVSREKFWSEDSFMNDLRLRASYAVVGNSELNSYFPYLGTYGSKLYGNQSGIAWNNMGNKDLQWESTSTFDLGIDGSLLNNRITFELAYWQKDSKDLVMEVSTAPSLGIPGNSYYANNGKVKNSGIEFTVGADLFRTKDFSWHTDINISTQHNSVKELNNHADVLPDNYTIIREGESYRSLYGYEYYGVNMANGNPIWVKGDGSLVQFDTFGDYSYHVYDPANPSDVSKDASLDPDGDRKVLGSVLPKWFGGWTNTFTYKNFDATVFFRFSGGNKILNATEQNALLNTNFCNQGSVILNTWRSPEQPGDGRIPKVGNGDGSALFNQGYTDSNFVENGSYLKLAQLAIGYTLPKNLVQKLDMQNIRLYVQAQNLFTITGYSGLDPESRASSSSYMGVDYNSMLMQRTFTFGASVTF